MNRLQNEKSPYLRAHASNPVDWYPWGEEAFSAAENERKPIFLSIGYSTCHWCHVMARESFEDEEVAKILNRYYISIKVDREERPDVDSVYMTVCTALNGSGGWPLTLILGPNRKPFWAGTYITKGQLIYLLEKAEEFWEKDYGSFLAQGNKITRVLAGKVNNFSEEPDPAVIEEGIKELRAMYDETFGGFGKAPKFPTPHIILFLLKYGKTALNMALGTLEHMYRGGIFDHIGGGFARYSTDKKWLVPHFEKTLYDNALLALCFGEAYDIAGEHYLKYAAERTFDYVLSELSHPDGGFYCGQDADSGGEEGAFYVFTKDEIKEILGNDADVFCECFGVTEEGNFNGGNILNLIENNKWDAVIGDGRPEITDDDPDKLPAGIPDMLRRMYEARRSRMELNRDDKILTSWNGLMIAALSRGGVLLGDPRYEEAAGKCIEFIFDNLVQDREDPVSGDERIASGGNIRLYSRWCDGEAAIDGKLADYIYLTWGLLEYYAAASDEKALSRACSIADEALEHFFDHENGGMYPYSSEGEQLILRRKDSYDDALPSCNSVGALVLWRLFELTGREDFRDAAKLQYEYIAGNAKSSPAGHCFSLYSLMDVCGTPAGSLWGTEDEVKNPELLPENSGRQYMCHDGVCDLPEE